MSMAATSGESGTWDSILGLDRVVELRSVRVTIEESGIERTVRNAWGRK